MNERLSRGELIAGIAGLVLILTMFIFAWYGLEGFSGDAFDALDDWVNIILVFTAFSAMSLALFGSDMARAEVPLSVVTTVLGGLSAIVILIYIISPPSIGFGSLGSVDLDTKFGVWLGLISAIAIAVGGWLTMQEEGTSFGGTSDRLGGGRTDAGTPPPPPTQTPPPPPPPPGGAA
jgi:hypothetical protein